MKIVRIVTLFSLAITFLLGCKTDQPVSVKVNPAFSSYVSAFTAGIISSESDIRVRLAAPIDSILRAEKPNFLSFSPDIEGELSWYDSQTIIFIPKDPLPYNQAYTGKLDLTDLMEIPEEMETFEFSFRVNQQRMFPSITSVKPYDNKKLEKLFVKGNVRTLDVCSNDEVEKSLTASQNGKKLEVTWTHEANRKHHFYMVDNVTRSTNESKVELKFNGKSIGIDQKETLEEIIPALGEFKIVDTRVVQQPDQYVVVRFSDPLKAKQLLDGIVTIKEVRNLKYTIEDNELHVYPPSRLSGSREIKIGKGLKNILGYKLVEEITANITFEEVKPSIELLENERHILPSTEGLVFPFKAVSLSAVDVKIIQVFENNVHQFLQVNNFDGDREMKRVGRIVKKKTIQLNEDGDMDLSVMNTFFLDLDDLIKIDKGSIYRVELSFRKAHSLYTCPEDEGSDEDNNTMASTDDNWDELDEDESSNWDYYSDYYEEEYYDDYYYDYSDRDNPCKNAYYHSRRKITKNIFASDLGVIAKAGNDQSMLVTVSNLISTDPMGGVHVELFNYQHQLIAEGITDADGKYFFKDLKAKPFVLVAKKGIENAYLKLNNGNSLSLSKFDVAGASVQKGIKGFLYGERGVWRPGDTLFLSFILEDEYNNLPKNHPVSFKLTNPRGQVVSKMIKTQGENNFYSFITKTDEEAITGTYNATVRVGGAVFNKPLKVETIKPNRLKINIDFGKEAITVLDKDLKGKMQVKWLHGAVARSLHARVGVTLKSIRTKFNRFNDFHFDDPVRRMTSEEQIIFDQAVNEEGEADLALDLDFQRKAPGMLKAYFSTKVFEEGGEFSVNRFSIPYVPYESFVGIKLPKGDKTRGMLLTDIDHDLEIMTVDANGEPMAVKDLEVKIYKVSWRWWWHHSSDDLSQYEGSTGITPYATGKVSTKSNGEAKFSFKVDHADWGRFLVRVVNPQSGHATGKTMYADWPGWAGRAQKDNPGGASMLIFSTDKQTYNVGDFCQVTFPSSGVGRGLVSIESGTRVIQADWVKATDTQTTYQFKVTEEMTPNVFVNITLVQPHNQTANDLPIRLYGVVPITVENQESHLNPMIDMADKLRPEEKFKVKIKEQNGKKMTYTLAVVDEGLLDLTNFHTPDPWNYFYAREALGVKTWDMYDEVIGAYGAKLEKLLSLGGDGENKNKGKNKANRFKPVVMYLGPFTLEKGQTATHQLTMPNYIGSVKVMVVAGDDKAYGKAEKVVPVKKPLMVLATLPRVVGPGEMVTLPVTVFAMEKNIKNVKIEIENNDFFSLQSDKTRNIKFEKIGDQVSNFTLKVSEKLGVGKVKVTVSSGKEISTYDIELDVRNPNPEVTTVIEGYVEAGQEWSSAYDLVGMENTNEAVIELSTLPAIDFNRRLRYLVGYPHGCVEQTTSKGFPQLFLGNVVDVSEKMKNKMANNVQAAINRLSKFQTSDGGMSYWPGGNSSNEWGTTYSGHFLLEAEAKGYVLPSGWKSSWIKYQRKTADNWRPHSGDQKHYYYRNDDLIQAYRLYTLAKAGSPELGVMNRLREKENLTLQARWRLAAAYGIAGQDEVAEELIKTASIDIPDYRALSYNYGSSLRDKAMIIETMTLMNKKEKASVLIRELCESLGQNRWYSTQTTAYSLLAISKFASGDGSEEMRFSYVVNGESSGNQYSNKTILMKELSVAQVKGNTINVSNHGDQPLFVRLIMSGKPVTGADTYASNQLSLNVNYYDMEDNEISITALEQGTDFKAVVSITHPGGRDWYHNMALTQIFPSGWEIINSRMDEVGSVHTKSVPTYQDIRDDRVYTYFDIYNRKTQSYVVLLNSSYQGHFYLPSVTCEAMYDKTIYARAPGQWVDVVPQGGKLAEN